VDGNDFLRRIVPMIGWGMFWRMGVHMKWVADRKLGL